MAMPREDVTRKRYNSGDYNKGRWQKGSATTQTIRAYVTPADGSNAESLPEGQRNRVRYYLSTYDDVRGTDTDDQHPPDEIVYDGETFIVRTISRASTGSPTGGQTEAFLLREIES